MAEPSVVAPVEPGGAAGPAAALLRRAWAPTAMGYTEGYLRWQLTFPAVGGLVPAAVAAVCGPEWTGFAAATPRQVLIGGEPSAVHLVSFVAVDPHHRGSGLGDRLYQALFEGLLEQGGQAVVTFAPEASAGLALLTRAYAKAGYREIDLGEYPALARVVPRGEPATPVRDEPPAAPAVDAGPLVANAPGRETWRHYFRDPRGPRWAAFPDRPGLSGRGAVVIRAERMTVRGDEPFPCAVNLFGGPFDQEDLAALARATDAVGPPGAVGTVPNPEGIAADQARGAGFRRLPASFRGKLFLGPGWRGSLPLAGRTTVEVV